MDGSNDRLKHWRWEQLRTPAKRQGGEIKHFATCENTESGRVTRYTCVGAPEPPDVP